MPKRADLQDSAPLSYRPSAYYFRKSIRETQDPAALRQLGLTLCSELEDLKAWVRAQGLIPPRFHATQAEAAAKNWAPEDHADAAPKPRPETG